MGPEAAAFAGEKMQCSAWPPLQPPPGSGQERPSAWSDTHWGPGGEGTGQRRQPERAQSGRRPGLAFPALRPACSQTGLSRPLLSIAGSTPGLWRGGNKKPKQRCPPPFTEGSLLTSFALCSSILEKTLAQNPTLMTAGCPARFRSRPAWLLPLLLLGPPSPSHSEALGSHALVIWVMSGLDHEVR